MSVVLIKKASGTVATPAAGKVAVFIDAVGALQGKDSAGTVAPLGGGGGGGVGVAGADGAPGAVWRSGSGVPSNALGIDGDYYLDTVTSDVYFRAAGAYTTVANIEGAVGPEGPAGVDGSDGFSGGMIVGTGVPAGGVGTDGQLYLDYLTWNLYGPKTAGVWGGISGSVAGADGVDGVDGAIGADGAAGASGMGALITGTITAGDIAVNMASAATCLVNVASLNANVATVTVTSLPAANTPARIMLRLTADGTVRTVDFTVNSNAVKWDGGSAPTLVGTSGHQIWLAIVSYDGTFASGKVEAFLAGADLS